MKLILVATLTVRTEAEAAFTRFERAAAAILRRHGGAIERTVRVKAAAGASTFQEVHLVAFPDAVALAAYRVDPELAALAPLRESAIVGTEILLGTDGPSYAPDAD